MSVTVYNLYNYLLKPLLLGVLLLVAKITAHVDKILSVNLSIILKQLINLFINTIYKFYQVINDKIPLNILYFDVP